MNLWILKLISVNLPSTLRVSLDRISNVSVLAYVSQLLLTFRQDLCVSAALDAVKENVQLPWVTSASDPPGTATSASLSVQHSQPEGQTKITEEKIDASLEISAMACSVMNTEAGQAAAIEPESSALDPSTQPRTLHLRNFTKALKEITPSSSESLGSLTELRKWNEEFGEGRQGRKRQQVWGRGRFGFVEYPKGDERAEEGRVMASRPRSKILEMLDTQ